MKNKPRKLQPTWIQLDARPHLLHRASNDIKANRNKYCVKNYTGTSMCGRFNERWWYPGVGSRLGASRCKHCCRAVGVVSGEGTTINAGIQEKTFGLCKLK